ncbi:MAG: hypothetical protein WBC71_15630 [Salaquimonas sp.]
MEGSSEVSIFENRFKGGHPNSLGNTVEIVEEILVDHCKLQALVDTWQSDDELVRLRVANGVRRVCVEKPEWIVPYLDHLLNDVSKIDQPSTQWTLAKLFEFLTNEMSENQKQTAKVLLKHNLAHHPDWIVLNNTMETLALWTKEDTDLLNWLKPQLERLTGETRKSVAGRAKKLLKKLDTKT